MKDCQVVKKLIEFVVGLDNVTSDIDQFYVWTQMILGAILNIHTIHTTT